MWVTGVVATCKCGIYKVVKRTARAQVPPLFPPKLPLNVPSFQNRSVLTRKIRQSLKSEALYEAFALMIDIHLVYRTLIWFTTARFVAFSYKSLAYFRLEQRFCWILTQTLFRLFMQSFLPHVREECVTSDKNVCVGDESFTYLFNLWWKGY